MKIAISVPDAIFEEAERMARRTKRTRSELYSKALADYLVHHDPDRVTEAMNRAVTEAGADVDPLVAASSRRVLKRVDW